MKKLRFISSFFIFLMISIHFLPGCKDKVKEATTIVNDVIDSTSIPDIKEIEQTLIDSNEFVRKIPEPNKFKNIQRLALWIGPQEAVPPKTSVQKYFAPLSSIKELDIDNERGVDVVVLAHGWAPGLLSAVEKAEYDIQWWDSFAVDANGENTSTFAWQSSSQNSIDITLTGFMQQIMAWGTSRHRKVLPLAYSWVDNSATLPISDKDHEFGGINVYKSESYTNLNGMRLADGLLDFLPSDFWTNSKNRLHIIGHSHGAKVATVATKTLQDLGKPVHYLTICDSPESEGSLNSDASNLLGHYLNKMKISPSPGGYGTFIDNYVSCFGVGYETPGVNNVALCPLYLDDDMSYSDQHAYSANWYGAAFNHGTSFRNALGFDWTSARPSALTANVFQTWDEHTEKAQWPLSNNQFTGWDIDCNVYNIYKYEESNPTETITNKVNVTDSKGTFSFSPSKDEIASLESILTLNNSCVYGFRAEINLEDMKDGDYFIIYGATPAITTNGPGTFAPYLILDSSVKGIKGWNSLSFNFNIHLHTEAYLKFEYYSDNGGSADVRNIGSIRVVDADGDCSIPEVHQKINQ